MQALTLKILRSFLALLLATLVPMAPCGTASRLAIEDINGTQRDLSDPNTSQKYLKFLTPSVVSPMILLLRQEKEATDGAFRTPVWSPAVVCVSLF